MNIFVLSDKHKKIDSPKIRGIWNPELYPWVGKKKDFWRLVLQNRFQRWKKCFCFYTWYCMDENGNKQAFIQILDGKKSTSEYIKFPLIHLKQIQKTYNRNWQKSIYYQFYRLKSSEHKRKFKFQNLHRGQVHFFLLV